VALRAASRPLPFRELLHGARASAPWGEER